MVESFPLDARCDGEDCLRIVSIDEVDEDFFLNYLYSDKILHFFTIYDLKFERDKTKVWIALEDEEISGYIFEFDRRIVHTHGSVGSIEALMPCIDLEEYVFAIEPSHFSVVERFYRIVEPSDMESRGRVTNFLVLKVNHNTFRCVIKHSVKRLGIEDLDDIFRSFGGDWRGRVKREIERGFFYGAYEDGLLASIAACSEYIEDLAIIRGVYTVPSLRNRGFAASATSALVRELLDLGMEVILWVARDNLPARRVYEKIGFQDTGYRLLGFKAVKL